MGLAEDIRGLARMALIELRDVSKTYDLGEVKVHALRETTLTIDEGEYIALVGPSGSGKCIISASPRSNNIFRS